MFYKSFYKRIKEIVWESIGIRLYQERSMFLVNLMKKLEAELNFKDVKNNQSSTTLLLDIGCGKGNLTEKISETYNLEAVGVDLGKGFNLSNGCDFLVADGCSLPFKPKSFLLVTAFSLIEHLHNNSRQKFYDEVKEVLTDMGIFIVQLPNRYFPIEQHTFIPFLGYLPSRLHSTFFHSYVSVPSRDDLVNQLIRRGFKIVRIVEYGVPFSSFLKRVFKKIFPFGFLIIAKKKA